MAVEPLVLKDVSSLQNEPSATAILNTNWGKIENAMDRKVDLSELEALVLAILSEQGLL